MKQSLGDVKTSQLFYRFYGNSSNPCIVIETAMGSCSAEWWHLAEKWSEHYGVLVYDRSGYGSSTISTLPRTPENVAQELNTLLNILGIQSPVIIIGHSLGGLFAYHFACLFPEKVRALVLLDPVAVDNYRLKKILNKTEYSQSGIDKLINLKLGLLVSSLRLGFIFKSLLKEAPPFYYYDKFSPEAEQYILKNSTQSKLYKSTIAEYEFIESEEKSKLLKEKSLVSNTPLFLICHDPEILITEIEKYGGADRDTATKIDQIWISLMQEYLDYSEKSSYQQATNSGHFIHLSNPDLLWETICKIYSNPKSFPRDNLT